ncbi:hypothetical protein WJX81_003453 [Elliptochloris bilobata]|uniref:NADH:ubiquinone oxidoreductase intermediate-associated protein 30 domain-containing protein n=1 Tax=Elliptochloris bilobata TaxID=381761 RepID=A0AAW1RK16_9CHLO
MINVAWQRFARSAKQVLKKVHNPLGEEERTLFSFGSAADLQRWNVFSDSQQGGNSTAALIPSAEHTGTASFEGDFSAELCQEAKEAKRGIQRSGFAGMHSLEGDYLDLEERDVLVLRVRGDGRKYLVSLRTDNWVAGVTSHDVWQAFLFAPPGRWEEVQVPLSRFLLTWKGRLVEERSAMNPERVVSLGIGLAGGPSLQAPGRFFLGLDWVKAVRMSGGLEPRDRSGWF